MLAMVTALGGLYAAILALEPARAFFDLELLSAGQWFICMLSVAAGLVVASALWRLPFIQRLEVDDGAEGPATIAGEPLPGPTHGSAGTKPARPRDRGEDPTEAL
jgi:hypothetical protein